MPLPVFDGTIVLDDYGINDVKGTIHTTIPAHPALAIQGVLPTFCSAG